MSKGTSTQWRRLVSIWRRDHFGQDGFIVAVQVTWCVITIYLNVDSWMQLEVSMCLVMSEHTFIFVMVVGK